VDFGSFVAGFADVLRAQLAVLLGGTATDVSAAASERLRENAAHLSAGDVLRMLNALSDLEPRFRKSGQQQLLVELMLVRFALIDRTLSLEDVLTGIDAGGTSSAGGGGQSPDWRAAVSAPQRPPERTAPRAPDQGAARTPTRPAGRQASPLTAMRSAMEASAQGEPPLRLSDDQRRAERAEMLRAKDPVLDAAVEALDLELLD
jgi:DNA polymerase-3 subunit gamma/tau